MVLISPNCGNFVIIIAIISLYSSKISLFEAFGPWSMVQGNPSIFNELNESGSNVITPAFITRFSIATRK